MTSFCALPPERSAAFCAGPRTPCTSKASTALRVAARIARASIRIGVPYLPESTPDTAKFSATESPPAIGTELKLRIKVVAPPREIVLCGEVASWHVGPHFEVGKRGMGIRFKDLSADDQAVVDELYDKQVERHLRGQ